MQAVREIIGKFKLEEIKAGGICELIFAVGHGGEVVMVIYSQGFLQRICSGDFPDPPWFSPRCSGDLQLIFEDGEAELQVVMVPPWCCAIFGLN
jgi:hypothetical protein